jgi:hypothetical protein
MFQMRTAGYHMNLEIMINGDLITKLLFSSVATIRRLKASPCKTD